MSRKTVILSTPRARQTAHEYLREADDGTVVTFAPKTRSLESNAKLWAMLGDVARQVDWYGKKLSPEDWKHVFTSGLRKLNVVPNLDGSGFVALGLSTSSMGVREMADLITLIEAFGVDRGVAWSEPETTEAPEAR